jgi:hypothetical protein
MSEETYNISRWSGLIILVLINLASPQRLIGFLVLACCPYAGLCG